MSYQLASREIQRDVVPSGRRAAEIGFQAIVGRSASILKAIQFSMRVATRRGTTVLIVGETGTGKGLFARGIHYASPEAQEPFVAVNCAAIPANLLASELFGHERGAFTDARARKRGLLELAGQGTLVLDEISELPLNLQPKLLRALEERRFRRIGGTDEHRGALPRDRGLQRIVRGRTQSRTFQGGLVLPAERLAHQCSAAEGAW